MVGHLTNEDPAPTKYTNAENSTPQLTDAFIAWRKSDRLLRGWIIGTLSEETLGLVVGLNTAHAVWETLKNAYAQDSQEPNSLRRPPPPDERRMTPAERDKYREQQCQYCGMTGHVAKICWWVPKKPTQQDEIPQALVALTLDTTIANTEWTMDTWASNHMTGKPGMLTKLHKYFGADFVLIGDGSSMPILAIGTENKTGNDNRETQG
ncbi:hypothetical protein Patl1_10265 [Pistacia atlantica]|uniref:Uncharacterized protein n=1 Tax=Pistacia atlantica TaxID=434234 RepID=A0ACC1A3V6_9ROSI|nr:hypothetical protein Patl1_10265 [Pistacia atlantica]